MIRLIFRNHQLSSEAKYKELLELIHKSGYRCDDHGRSIDVFSNEGMFEYDKVVELFDCTLKLIEMN